MDGTTFTLRVLVRNVLGGALWAVSVGCGGLSHDAASEEPGCKPDQSRCVGSRILDACDAEGAWGTRLEACDGECVTVGEGRAECEEPTGTLDQPECEPGDARCVGDRIVEACDLEGAWGLLLEVCDNKCVSAPTGVAECGDSCAPGEFRCQDTTLFSRCDADGEWGESISCGESACFEGLCVGECSPESYRCTPTGDSEICDGTGTWRNNEMCTPPDLLCSVDVGLCEDNPVFTIGKNSDTGGLKASASNDYLYATPILVEDHVMALRLGVFTDASSIGGRIKLALYSDRWDGSNHRPHQRLAYTSGFTMDDGPKAQMRTLPLAEKLTPGAVYWVAILVSELSSEKVAFVKHPATLSLADGWSGGYMRWGGPAYVETPPWEWASPDATYTTGMELSIFVEAQRYWR